MNRRSRRRKTVGSLVLVSVGLASAAIMYGMAKFAEWSAKDEARRG